MHKTCLTLRWSRTRKRKFAIHLLHIGCSLTTLATFEKAFALGTEIMSSVTETLHTPKTTTIGNAAASRTFLAEKTIITFINIMNIMRNVIK